MARHEIWTVSKQRRSAARPSFRS